MPTVPVLPGQSVKTTQLSVPVLGGSSGAGAAAGTLAQVGAGVTEAFRILYERESARADSAAELRVKSLLSDTERELWYGENGLVNARGEQAVTAVPKALEEYTRVQQEALQGLHPRVRESLAPQLASQRAEFELRAARYQAQQIDAAQQQAYEDRVRTAADQAVLSIEDPEQFYRMLGVGERDLRKALVAQGVAQETLDRSVALWESNTFMRGIDALHDTGRVQDAKDFYAANLDHILPDDRRKLDQVLGPATEYEKSYALVDQAAKELGPLGERTSVEGLVRARTKVASLTDPKERAFAESELERHIARHRDSFAAVQNEAFNVASERVKIKGFYTPTANERRIFDASHHDALERLVEKPSGERASNWSYLWDNYLSLPMEERTQINPKFFEPHLSVADYGAFVRRHAEQVAPDAGPLLQTWDQRLTTRARNVLGLNASSEAYGWFHERATSYAEAEAGKLGRKLTGEDMDRVLDRFSEEVYLEKPWYSFSHPKKVVGALGPDDRIPYSKIPTTIREGLENLINSEPNPPTNRSELRTRVREGYHALLTGESDAQAFLDHVTELRANAPEADVDAQLRQRAEVALRELYPGQTFDAAAVDDMVEFLRRKDAADVQALIDRSVAEQEAQEPENEPLSPLAEWARRRAAGRIPRPSALPQGR